MIPSSGSLLPLSEFAHVFEPMRWRSVLYVPIAFGNPGDALIEATTIQLLHVFGIQYRVWHGGQDKADVILFPGGGGIGFPHIDQWMRVTRGKLLGEAVLLPSCFFATGNLGMFDWVWARDTVSMEIWPLAGFAPDLSLGYAPPFEIPPATKGRALILRRGHESVFPRHPPGTINVDAWPRNDVSGYILHAAQFVEIVTDKLHVAICGLIARRKVTLLPNVNHKNRAMWERWLSGLGCQWRDQP